MHKLFLTLDTAAFSFLAFRTPPVTLYSATQPAYH